jgi:hypothetical protein
MLAIEILAMEKNVVTKEGGNQKRWLLKMLVKKNLWQSKKVVAKNVNDQNSSDEKICDNKKCWQPKLWLWKNLW